MKLVPFLTASLLLAATFAFVGCETGVALTGPLAPGVDTENGLARAKVGRFGENFYVTPTSQILRPAGQQVELPKMRPQALALSPDGELLVTSGRAGKLVVINPANGVILQTVALSTNKSEVEGKVDEPTATPAGP